jgi:hypothetical protein
MDQFRTALLDLATNGSDQNLEQLAWALFVRGSKTQHEHLLNVVPQLQESAKSFEQSRHHQTLKSKRRLIQKLNETRLVFQRWTHIPGFLRHDLTKLKHHQMSKDADKDKESWLEWKWTQGFGKEVVGVLLLVVDGITHKLNFRTENLNGIDKLQCSVNQGVFWL